MLSITLLLPWISINSHVYAATQERVGVNIAMVESLLNERNWVVETLVYDNYTNNPYTSTIAIEATVAPV